MSLSIEEVTRRLESGQALDPEVRQWITEFADRVREMVDAFKGLNTALGASPRRHYTRRHYRLNRARRPGRR